MEGTITAAVLGNRYDYLMRGIRQRTFTKVVQERNVFYRNQALIDSFKPLCMTDTNVHHFVFDILQLDKRNVEMFVPKNGHSSLMQYIQECDYKDFANVVLPLVEVNGILNFISEMCVTIC